MEEGLWYEEEYKGYTIKVYREEDAPNPRTEWDNLGKMLFSHRRYDIGDKHEVDTGDSMKEFGRNIQAEYGNGILIPVKMYDHSEIGFMAITGNSPLPYPFNCPWDSGYVGYLYMSFKDMMKEWGKKSVSKKLKKQATDCLLGELEVYNAYVSGDVAFYVIEDEEGCVLESCGGYYGKDNRQDGYMMQEAKSMVDHITANASFAVAI